MRGEKPNAPTKKARILRATDKLAVDTLRVLCREDIFPKRSRWVMANKMADLVNDFHTCIMIANGIQPESHAEFVERHKYQVLAGGYLYALDVKMNLAKVVFETKADKLEFWAAVCLEAKDALSKWKSSDKYRYSKKFGPLTPEEENIGEAVEPTAVRSPNPSNANNMRTATPDGALNNNNNANNTNGGVADRENVRSSKPNAESKALTQGTAFQFA